MVTQYSLVCQPSAVYYTYSNRTKRRIRSYYKKYQENIPLGKISRMSLHMKLDLRRRLEFDCNQQASLYHHDARLHIGFNAFQNCAKM